MSELLQKLGCLEIENRENAQKFLVRNGEGLPTDWKADRLACYRFIHAHCQKAFEKQIIYYFEKVKSWKSILCWFSVF